MAPVRSRTLVATVVLLATAAATAVGAAGAGAVGTRAARVDGNALHGVNILGRDLDAPTSVASDGTHVWVVNTGNSTVSMLDAATGLTDRTESLPSVDDASGPYDVVTDGAHVWIANASDDSVTELNERTGSVVRVLRAAAYGFDDPVAMVSDSVDVWITNERGDSVTEVDAATGALVHLLHGASFGFDAPRAIGFDGTDLWVLNVGGDGSISEVDAATDSATATFAASTFDGASPVALAVVGNRLWIANSGNDTISVIATSTGALDKVLNGGAGGLAGVAALVAAGDDVWATGSRYRLTELRASNGSVVRSVREPSGATWSGTVADDGSDLWVAGGRSNNVTELSATTGAVVRTTYGSPFELSTPDAIAAVDGYVWVANAGDPPTVGESLVEFAAGSGAFVRQVSDLTLAAPRQLAACAGQLWLGSGYGSVVELNAVTGRTERVVRAASAIATVEAFACDGRQLWVAATTLRRHDDTTTIDAIDSNGKTVHRFAITSDPRSFVNSLVDVGGHLWLTASGHDSLTVLDATTGAIVHAYDDTASLSDAGTEYTNGTDVFVASFNTVVELDATTGAIVRTLRGAAYQFHLPTVLVGGDHTVLVVSAGGDVTTVSTANGSVLHVFRGSPYDFAEPSCAARAGANLWVANAAGESVTEFPA
jgi:DNA-binding beta-propeller fold protein YncE